MYPKKKRAKNIGNIEKQFFGNHQFNKEKDTYTRARTPIL